MLSTLRPPSHEALPWGKPLESNAIPSLDWGPFRAQKPAAEEGLHAQQSEEFSLFSSPPTMLLKTPLLHYATPSSFSYFHFPFISKLEQPPVHCQPSFSSLAGLEQNFQERLDSRLGRFVASPHQDSVDEHPLPFFIELPSPSFSQPLPLSTDCLSPRDAFYRSDTTQYRHGHDEVESPCSSSPPSDNSDEENSFEDRQKKSSSNLSSETPSAKAAFKVFLRQFKKKEKEGGFESAATYAKQQLAVLPLCIHWKVCLELADLVKRENMVGEARHWYTQVLQLQPAACQGWLEFAKLEEECGKLQRCRELLMQGLSNCPWSESLLVKALKHEERMGNLKGARALLARLKEEPLDKTWRTVLEGGLMEARAGNIHTAREVFKYLLKHVPWYGPVFNEAFRFEEKYENFKRAASIVEKGLQENPRYGPLWFSALRVFERQILEGKASLEKVRKSVERALEAVPKELVWKVHFEAAQIEERAGQVDRCRKAYAVAATHCPENLRWKIWVAGARTELSINHVEAGRKLLERAVDAAPKKVRAAVLLECSRLEEYLENTDTARAILRKAQKETKHEWRVFLESVLLEIRAGNVDGAIEQAQQALKVHTGTGRLWAVLIHLYQLKGLPNQQVEVFKEALEEVPKSGEVWCEGARIAMRRRDFKAARRYLDFAIQFTPQYGDSFIEYLALELMEHGPEHPTPLLEQQCINADPNYGFLWLQCKVHPLDSAREVLRVAREAMLGRYPPLSTGGGMGLSLSTLSLPSPHPVDSVSIGYSPNMERYRMIYGGEPIKA